MKKPKVPPNDGGLSAKEIAKLRSAIRMVWQRGSYARKLTIKRCLDMQGFPQCDYCDSTVPKIYVDHIVPCGAFDGGYIERMFVSTEGLQGLCKKCHDRKTKEERKK